MTPLLAEANSAGEWLVAGGAIIGVTLWMLHGFLMFGIWLLSSIGTSTVIARERETQNWSLLRITPLNIAEIIHAKVVGVLRWLTLPLALAVILRIVMVAILFIAAIVVIFFAVGAASLTPQLQTTLALGSVVASLIVAVYLIVELAAVMLYNCSIGLLSSVLARTSANAIAIMFILHFGINFFVIVPAQQMTVVALSLFSLQWMSDTNPLSQAIMPFISFGSSILINLAMQIGIGITAYVLAVHQAQKIND